LCAHSDTRTVDAVGGDVALVSICTVACREIDTSILPSSASSSAPGSSTTRRPPHAALVNTGAPNNVPPLIPNVVEPVATAIASAVAGDINTATDSVFGFVVVNVLKSNLTSVAAFAALVPALGSTAPHS